MERNPFSVIFGREPSEMIARTPETDQVLSACLSDPSPTQIFMITGVRGSGKTVFMTDISEKIRRNNDWIVVELNPEYDLLEDLASKLSSDNVLSQIFQHANINLSFFGLGVDISGTAAITNMEVAVTRMLQSIKEKNKKILITIDEVSNTPSMRKFAHSFQIFIRKNLPVYLIMTGLFENIDALQNEKTLTFLFRAPKIILSPLSQRDIASSYTKLFRKEPTDAAAMARLTMGYPFAYQVLGYLTWEADGQYRDVIEDYKRYLADYSYDKIWNELSAEDRRILFGIASSDSNKISEIRSTLAIDTNHFNPYRKRLIRKGLLNGDQYGYVRLVLPCFRDYILETYEAHETT